MAGAQSSILRFFNKLRKDERGEENVSSVSETEPTPFQEQTAGDTTPEASNFKDTEMQNPSLECGETSTTPIGTTPTDLSVIDKPPSQPVMTTFPYTNFAGKNRCFSPKW